MGVVLVKKVYKEIILKNILYIDIDTMSPRHMSCYGYNRPTTPNIDKLVQEASCARFDNFYTSDAPCLPSRTSLVTGQFGIRHGVTDHGGKYSDLRSELNGRNFMRNLEYDGLFSLMKRAGMKTVSISSFSSRHSAWHFNCGFNEVYCYGDSATQQAPEIHQIASDWLSANKEQSGWCLHYHLWDPHTPYRVPDSYQPEFINEPFEYWVDEELLTDHRAIIGPHTASSLNMYESVSSGKFKRALGQIKNSEDLKTVIDGYDLGIHYADYHIGLLIDQLKAQGQYEQTIIVITADHGENMGELGLYSEHGTADIATCHIPFIVNVPGKDYRGRVFDKFHYNLDIVPTVAQFLNLKPIVEHLRAGDDVSQELELELIDAPKCDVWDGNSMFDIFETGVDSGHDYLVLSQMSHGLQRGVVFDQFLYIQTYHSGYRTNFEPEMLFNISNDPYEQKNIAADNPEIVLKAKAYLFDWYNQQMAKLEFGHCEDPLWYIYHHQGPCHAKDNLKAKFIDNLEQAGRVSDAQKLKDHNQRY